MLEAVNKGNAADPKGGVLMAGRHRVMVRHLTSLGQVMCTSLAAGKHFLTHTYFRLYSSPLEFNSERDSAACRSSASLRGIR